MNRPTAPLTVLVPILAIALLCAAAAPPPTGPPNPTQVRARSLHASVRVIDGVATTRLRLTLANGGARPAEATWILPLPEGSVADDFRMIVGGVETRGEVLAAAGTGTT